MAKLCGNKAGAKQALRARLSELEAQSAKLTAHLSVVDVQTATTLGLYAKAKALAEERQQVQGELAELAEEAPEMPSPKEIARRADEEMTHLDQLLDSGSLEEKRELVRQYVKHAIVDPSEQTVELAMMPALFSWIGTGT